MSRRSVACSGLLAAGLVVATLPARPTHAFQILTPASEPCHERATLGAIDGLGPPWSAEDDADVEPLLRALASQQMPAFDEATAAFVKSVAKRFGFAHRSDRERYVLASLLAGARDPDTAGFAIVKINEARTIHVNDDNQSHHSLRRSDDDGEAGNAAAIARARQRVLDRVDAAAQAWRLGAATIKVRWSFPFYGEVSVRAAKTAFHLGEAAHAVQDAFTHTLRDDALRIVTVANFVDIAQGRHVESRDGIGHSDRLDTCDVDGDEFDRLRFSAARSATADLLAGCLQAIQTPGGGLAQVEAVLDRVYALQPGCDMGNDYCGSAWVGPARSGLTESISVSLCASAPASAGARGASGGVVLLLLVTLGLAALRRTPPRDHRTLRSVIWAERSDPRVGPFGYDSVLANVARAVLGTAQARWLGGLTLAYGLAGCGTPTPAEGAAGGEGQGQNEADVGWSGEGEGEADGGGDPAVPQAGLPTPPRWDCPAGWGPVEVDLGQPEVASACAPAERRTCGAGTVQGLADAECRPIGHPCPDARADDAWIRARAEGAQGPILRLGEGADLAAAAGQVGVIVYLQPGRYAAAEVSVGAATWIVGACASRTTLQARLLRLPGDGGLTGLTLEGTLRMDGGAAHGVVIRDSPGVGLITDTGRSDLRDLVIRDPNAAGLVALGDAVVEAAGLVVERAVGVAIVAPVGEHGEPAGELRLADVVVREVLVRPDGTGGVGIALNSGGRTAVRRALFELTIGAAIELAANLLVEPVTASLEDVVIRHGRPRLNSDYGAGLQIGQAAEVEVRRLFVDGAPLVGILLAAEAAERPAALDAEDVVIRQVRAGRAPVAFGVALGGAATLTLRRAGIQRADGGGVLVGLDAYPPGGMLDAEDLIIHDILAAPAEINGRGLEVKRGGRAEVRRLAVGPAMDAGVVVIGWAGSPETRARFEELTVQGITPSPCAEIPADEAYTCQRPEGGHTGGGHGLVAVHGARLSLDGFRLANNAVAGLLVARDAEVDARRGVITGNSIGLNNTLVDYDLDRLSERVFVFDNGVDVASEELAVPAPAEFFP